jgi:hypothetical protein
MVVVTNDDDDRVICFFLKFKSIVLVKRALFMLNAAFSMEIFDLISQVYLPSTVNIDIYWRVIFFFADAANAG